MEKVNVKIVQTHKDLPLPEYKTGGSACCDLISAEDCVVPAKSFRPIDTGVKMAIPQGYEVQIRGRSGLAYKHGIGVVQGIGTIDSDYRGPIFVLLVNNGHQDYEVKRGERIAQMSVCKISQVEWALVDDLDETERGSGGLGHTGRF
ncbi:MAG: dUTP diphosphatase [archaeon]